MNEATIVPHSQIVLLPFVTVDETALRLVRRMEPRVAALVALELARGLEEIHASGDLEARCHTEIAAEVDGRVTELAIDEGGSVEKGAVVIELDPERRQLDLAAAEARLSQARANLRKERSQTRRIRELRGEAARAE